MHSPNLSIGKRKHINLSIKRSNDSPFFIIPTIYFISNHDVNLEIEGMSIGICIFKTNLQINFRKASWPKKPSAVDLAKANALSLKIQETFSSAPDALAIVTTFERNRWLRELTSRGVDETYYGLKIIKEASRDHTGKKEEIQTSVNLNSEVKIDGFN